MIHKIRKLEKLFIDGKATLVDEDGAPLKKVQVAASKPSSSSPCTSSKKERWVTHSLKWVKYLLLTLMRRGS